MKPIFTDDTLNHLIIDLGEDPNRCFVSRQIKIYGRFLPSNMIYSTLQPRD